MFLTLNALVKQFNGDFLRPLLLIISSYDVLDTARKFEWVKNRPSKKKIMAMRRRWYVTGLETGYKAKMLQQMQLSSLAVTTLHIRSLACVMWVAVFAQKCHSSNCLNFLKRQYKRNFAQKKVSRNQSSNWEVEEPQLCPADVTQMRRKSRMLQQYCNVLTNIAIQPGLVQP